MEHEERLSRDDEFARWYAEHHGRLRAFCTRILHDPAAAEDVTQETLLRAWTKRETIREADVGAWLSVVARNACVSYVRKHRRMVPSDSLPESADPSADPSLIVERQETGRLVRRALADVGERQRRMLYLREVRGVSYEELAEELGLTEGGARTLLFRARAVLRERLALVGEGVGAWLLGVRLRIASLYRRGRASIVSSNASAEPLLQAGMNFALAASLAIASLAVVAPSNVAVVPGGTVVGRSARMLVAIQPGAPLSDTSAPGGTAGSSTRIKAAVPGGASIEPHWRYNPPNGENHFHVDVDAPVVGHRSFGVDGGESSQGHSIFWDDLVNPTLASVCAETPKVCGF